MSNSKISALTSATTPLAGTETLPVVQSSATTKVTVANLTAGRVVGTGGISNSGVFSSTASGTGTANRATFSAASEPFAIYLKYNTSTSGVYLGSSSVDNFAAYTSGGNGLWYASSTALSVPGNVVPLTAGQGINFTANTPTAGKTSQLLNWYEEGTWTPTNIGGALVVVGTFSSSGVYTRIGRQVTVQGTLNGSTSVAISGGASAVCGGLPFACRAAVFPGTAVNGGATASAVLYANSNTTVGSVTSIAATSSIFFSITYMI